MAFSWFITSPYTMLVTPVPPVTALEVGVWPRKAANP